MTMTTTDPPTMTDTDRIEKKVQLNAPRSRVWRAIADSKQFGEWFRVNLDGAFAEGKTVRGNILHPGYEHMTMEMMIERIEPERYFSYRWHPYAIDANFDYSQEPTTLVEFRLEEVKGGGGTALTIVESGFDRVPLARRAEAFRMNEKGWTGQVKAIEKYVSKP
ncbi:MAG: SRPBCC family protein [Gemmatimonadaceae bacterium]